MRKVAENQLWFWHLMPVNSTHPNYDHNLPVWQRARAVFAGEDVVKAAGATYLPRLDSQSDDEYAAYKMRSFFFNATARTADGFIGLIFRREPTFKLPDIGSGVGRALNAFSDNADLMGTTLSAYAKNVVTEVVGMGRAGTLVDWESGGEQRACAVLYPAEQIINWQRERVNGRQVLTLVVLRETCPKSGAATDPFQSETIDQLRVLKLVPDEKGAADGPNWTYQVEIWQPQDRKSRRHRGEWTRVEKRTPLRLGKPLPLIPFVFHGPRHSLPDVDKLLLADIIAINLDHYRLTADYKHGLHFTALPTAWVSGFDKTSNLTIGSSTAWVSETPGATAGFLEFTGQGLTTFERAIDRDEQLMAVLGSRMLEAQKRVGETADAIELRQSGENSVLSGVAASVSDSLTHILRWVYWWHSTEASPEIIGADCVLARLNSDFSTKGMASDAITAIVQAWQANAISRETMWELFRKGEVLPAGRTNQEEQLLVSSEKATHQPPKGVARA